MAQQPHLRADRAPLRLRRVGGEDHADGKKVEKRLAALGIQPGGAHEEGRLFHGLRARLGKARALPLPQHADALAILGEIHEVEEDREGPHDGARLRIAQGADAGEEHPLGVLATLAPRARAQPDLLLQVVQRRPGLLADDLS